MYGTPVIGKVCNQDADVVESSKDAGAEATNWSWSHLCQVHRADNYALAHPEPSDKAAGVDGSQVSIVAHKDGNADNPKHAELTSGPDASYPVTDQESPFGGKSQSTSRLKEGKRKRCSYQRAPPTEPI
jgi:hypothetical protein